MSYPILYSANDADLKKGIVPANNGLGALMNITSPVVTEEKQGTFTFEFDYQAPNGFDDDYLIQRPIFDAIVKDNVVKAKANDYDGDRLFRIDTVEFDAVNESKHVTAMALAQADLFSNAIVSVDVKGTTPTGAVNALLANAVTPTKFTSWTDVTTTANYKQEYVNVLSGIAGVEGSIIDVWRTDLEWDNFTIRMHKSRGADRGVRIAYSKNLTGLTALTSGDVTTRIIPFAQLDNGDGTTRKITLAEVVIDAPNVADFYQPLALPVDFSQEMTDAGYTSEAQLRTLAKAWFEKTGNNVPKVNFTINFVQLSKTEEYKEYAILEHVALFDTVHIYHERYGIEIDAKVSKYTYDPVSEMYIEIELGDAKYSLQSKAVNDAQTQAQLADQLTGIHDFIALAIDHATNLITGNDGGYVLLYPPRNPAEIFIMDTDDVNTAKQVLRMNKSGIGFSSTGVNGQYRSAWTLDGRFNADFITAGTLQAIDIKGVNITGSKIQADSFVSSFMPPLPAPQYEESLRMGGGAGFYLTAKRRNYAFPAMQFRMNTTGDLGVAIEAVNETTGAINTDKVIRISPWAGVETPFIQSIGWCSIGADATGKVASIDRTSWDTPTLKYVPHVAAAFQQGSSALIKQDIEKFDESRMAEKYSATEMIRTIEVFSYRLKQNIEQSSFEKTLGFIAETLPPELRADDMQAVDLYKTCMWLWQYARENEDEKQALEKRVSELEELVYALAERS
ncbi:hypothetical protein HB904_04525 [Listeria booriae]|uniref:Tail spike domain-containing protein n=1 Tax=Listeria booriae TaxID=1552123 RepID=A0A842ADN7_9LIST|nr:phage tail spike protein [Listeria booriae]MBC1615437.1 hypothetical protein [Listeria booriae]